MVFIAIIYRRVMFQSTRPHGARHPVVGRQFLRFLVSIHAPARGATYYNLFAMSSVLCFNPRARTGRDVFEFLIFLRGVSFNPRARTGRDAILSLVCYCPALFQSTRPHGARLLLFVRHSLLMGGFNPRARTGRDIATLSLLLSSFLFQSTRPHGARPDR